jgi:hypothetical protein
MDHFHFKATLVARSWSRSKPDILYGYVWKAFTPAQEQFMAIDMTEHTANSQGLIYPFLVIELKGDGPGPTAGSLWVATNQCLLGGAATCMVSLLTGFSMHQPPSATIFRGLDALGILDLTACERVRDDAIGRIIPSAPRLRGDKPAQCTRLLIYLL